MSFTKKISSRIIPCLLYFLFVTTDAHMPKCRDDFDKCQCHFTYSNEEMDGDNSPKSCLKLHDKKLNWFDAEAACKKEFSYLLYNYTSSNLIEDFREKGVELIWIGVRRISGFYISLVEEKLYKESMKQWGKKWGENEPIHDCVALHTSAGYLVTRPCSTKLEFVCQNNGFPVYPVAKSLACPEEWFMFYQLPETSKKCIKPFKRGKDVDNSIETCSKFESQVADDINYYALYTNMSTLGITDFEIKENTECVTELIGAVLGRSLFDSLNFTCSEALFICEKDTNNISVTARILPEYSDSLSSSNTSQGLLTCDLSIHGRNITGKENQIHYLWFQNGIPVHVDSHLHQLSFYADPTKVLSTTVIRQGAYQCGVMIEGFQNSFLSKEMDYFFSDVSTFILTLKGDARDLGYFDFSRIGFRKFRNKLNETMTTFTAGLPLFFPVFEWDYQKAWLNGKNATVQLLLYCKRNFDNYSAYGNEKTLYHALRKHFLERQPISGKSASFSLLLQSADVCFEKVISSKTPGHATLFWGDTVQTKWAVSRPMCLNDWKLVTRECKPSVIGGARWISFNNTKCTKYQSSIKDLKTVCPIGFKELDRNLCYRVFKEERNLIEAKETCQNESNYLMDAKSLTHTKIISQLGT